MDLIPGFAGAGVAVVGILVFAAQMLTLEIGHWIGRTHRDPEAEEREGIGLVVGSMLGLMSFVVAISLNFTSSRFEERRQAGLQEANAIGTAWLRAETIGNERGALISRHLQDYARVRAEFITAPLDAAKLDELERRSSDLQGKIWREFSLLMREQTNPATGNLQVALNDTFDAAATIRFAFSTPLASQLFWMLGSMTLIAMLALGYDLGLRGRPRRVLVALLACMWTVVIVQIVDLGAARHGGIRPSTQPYDWLIQGFNASPNG